MTETKTAPEVPHANLIARHDARLIKRVAVNLDRDVYHTSGFEADVRNLLVLAIRLRNTLAVLGDTVPREQYDALARVIEQVRRYRASDRLGIPMTPEDLDSILDTAPAASLALHNAEVWDQGFEEGVGVGHTGDHYEGGLNPYRAAPIREEAK